LDPEILRILSCVKIASSLEVILIFAPLSSAILRIVSPPRPVKKKKKKKKKKKREREREGERRRKRKVERRNRGKEEI
jgi:hypothetical protein